MSSQISSVLWCALSHVQFTCELQDLLPFLFACECAVNGSVSKKRRSKSVKQEGWERNAEQCIPHISDEYVSTQVVIVGAMLPVVAIKHWQSNYMAGPLELARAMQSVSSERGAMMASLGQ